MFVDDSVVFPSHDPDFTGGGHQPMGFDEMIALYDHYTVVSAKITVTCFHNENVPMIWGIETKDNTTLSSTNINYLQEKIGNRWTFMGEANKTKTLTKTVNCAKFLSKDPMGNPEMQGSSSANPVEGVNFLVWCGPAEAAAVDLSAKQFNVRLEYWAFFTEPHSLPNS